MRQFSDARFAHCARMLLIAHKKIVILVFSKIPSYDISNESSRWALFNKSCADEIGRDFAALAALKYFVGLMLFKNRLFLTKMSMEHCVLVSSYAQETRLSEDINRYPIVGLSFGRYKPFCNPKYAIFSISCQICSFELLQCRMLRSIPNFDTTTEFLVYDLFGAEVIMVQINVIWYSSGHPHFRVWHEMLKMAYLGLQNGL